MMFPLPLLPTIPDNLERMKARRALLYQNTFMKNALIRALNTLYDFAPKIKASQPAFCPFMAYADTICDMISLHVQGDEVFFKSLSQQCNAPHFAADSNAPMLQDRVSSLRRQIQHWKKNSESYQPSRLQDCLGTIGTSMTKFLQEQVVKFTSDALPPFISDERLSELIKENMIWLGTNSDMSILLPFCVSHHDPKTSKHWPPVTHDAVQAIPELVEVHPHLWTFAPFDAVTGSSKKIVL